MLLVVGSLLLLFVLSSLLIWLLQKGIKNIYFCENPDCSRRGKRVRIKSTGDQLGIFFCQECDEVLTPVALPDDFKKMFSSVRTVFKKQKKTQ